jgi:hypothetical protein
MLILSKFGQNLEWSIESYYWPLGRGETPMTYSTTRFVDAFHQLQTRTISPDLTHQLEPRAPVLTLFPVFGRIVLGCAPLDAIVSIMQEASRRYMRSKNENLFPSSRLYNGAKLPFFVTFSRTETPLHVKLVCSQAASHNFQGKTIILFNGARSINATSLRLHPF